MRTITIERLTQKNENSKAVVMLVSVAGSVTRRYNFTAEGWYEAIARLQTALGTKAVSELVVFGSTVC